MCGCTTFDIHSPAVACVGEGLLMIGSSWWGHTQVQTTARYAHLANDPIKSAADRIARRISGSANGDDKEGPAPHSSNMNDDRSLDDFADEIAPNCVRS